MISEGAVDRTKADAILLALTEGKSLRKAAKSNGIADSTFLLWVSNDKALAEQYAQARETGIEADFERLCELRDESPVAGPSGGVDPGWVAWRRLQMDTMRWALSKRAPKKYGEKLDLNHSGGVQIRRVEVAVVDPKG